MRFVVDLLGTEIIDIKINHVDTTSDAKLGFANLGPGGEA